ncbi:MAG: polyribonucleotide nucleotidyltransferase [Puniceicoccales bacterium]|jgi:polyribonucleotide nucleotidyltransferase|nr:polyribonucleotide nucleotidyltransferase [Puniceicoccales bacterium]
MKKNQSIGSIQAHEEVVDGLSISFSAGNLARRAGGAVTVQLGESVVFVAATAAAKVSPDQDYFPLSVEYKEKFCAAGRFPGGYVRREGRPSEKEILTARLCDRPLRPLFPKGFRNEVQVVGLLLAADLKNEPDVLMVNGASAALMCSDIPWDGPIGCVRIGEIGGKFIVNPTNEELYESNLDLLYVGNCDDMMMVEGSADQISENRFIEALEFAQRNIQPIISAQRRLAEKFSKAKMEFSKFVAPKEIIDHCRSLFADELRAAMELANQRECDGALAQILERARAAVAEKFGVDTPKHVVSVALDELKESICRSEILDRGRRADGRAMDEVRQISCDVGFLPRVHGISLFQRGETQAMVSVTLGTSRDAQALDGITGGTNEKSFILHYNFPPFSVGETGRFGTPGRREIGHGALAERSLLPVIPDAETFPYSIRLVSEILESNGSSSMATVCAGTAAMMDAGVPILAPVTGISTGLVTATDDSGAIVNHVVLTDITGSEDHYGDMDFKIAGTDAGITGFQLDLKIPGLPLPIAEEAVKRNGIARAKIREAVCQTIAEPRSEMRPCAPRMRQLQISPEKIGALIGPGGKNIKRIVDETGAQVNVCQDNSGKVSVFATTAEAMEAAVREIEAMNSEIEVGKTYRGIVRGIKEFGAFVECLPGKEGLVHVSELDAGRVENVEDVCKVGDEIVVRCVGVDEKGRVRLSRRAAICEARGIPYEDSRSSGGPSRERRDGGGGGFRRGGGGEGRPMRERNFREDRPRFQGRSGGDGGRGAKRFNRGDYE